MLFFSGYIVQRAQRVVRDTSRKASATPPNTPTKATSTSTNATTNASKSTPPTSLVTPTPPTAPDAAAVAAAAPPVAPPKRKKNVAAPKSPMSAFLFYTRDAFAAMRKAIGGKVSVSQIAGAARDQWAALSTEQRAPYEALALAERERYSREKAEYELTLPPKRALSPYSYFIVEQRPSIIASNPNMSFADVGRELGRQWSALPPSHPQRRRCEEQALADRMRYVRDKAAYDRNN
jgi:hypothetical protein